MLIKKDQITPHFRLSEFACSGEVIITPEFVTFVTRVLEPFRIWYDRPININSGYRSIAKNNQVGGVPSSLHLRAMAIDTNLPVDYLKGSPDRQREFFDHVRSMWFSLCKTAGGYGQICWYDTYMHLGFSWEREYFEDKRRGKKEWIM
jgi:hypothetical protein